jgi:hypothetical protein
MNNKSPEPITPTPAHPYPHLGHYELHPPPRRFYPPSKGEPGIDNITSLALALGWTVKWKTKQDK